MSENPPVRVIVCDDQAAVREGLATLLGLAAGIVVAGTARDGAEAVALTLREQPDVVLMDLRMPVMDGVEATRRIRRDTPSVRVVVLTTYADDESVISALQAGAIGYLTKDARRDEIARAVHAAAAGQSVMDAEVQQRLLRAATTGDGAKPADQPEFRAHESLTTRELDVLRHIAQGLSNDEIAATLSVSAATVKTHINHVFAKTGCRDRAQAVAYAFRIGIVHPR